MKILKIEFTNINSLRGSHEIDFTKEPFISSSLFAITGPTGSGKSTILDVIALALYGKIPRIPGSRPISKTDIEKFGTILTRNQKEAIARVTYECKYGIFSSQWNISTNRNDNLRDNDMEIFDHQKQELITDKKSEVPDKNEELIGLSYDQFIKSVLLAQGEFAQFLKVTKKERGALLEKITGTGIYRLIGQKVYEKNGLLNKDIEKQQTEIGILKDSLLEEEILKARKDEIQQKTNSIKQFQAEIELLRKFLELKENIRNRKKEIKLLEEEKQAEINNLASFDREHGAPLQEHEKVQDLAEDLRNWKLLCRDLHNLTTENNSVVENLKVNSEKSTQLISEVSEFIKEQTTTENFSSNLSEFRKKVQGLNELKNEKLNEYKLEKTRLESELQAVNIKFSDSNSEQLIQHLQKLITETETSIKDWNDEFKISTSLEIETLKNQSQKDYKITREATREYAGIEEIQKELNRNLRDLEQLLPHLQSLPPEIEKSKIKAEKLEAQLEILVLKQRNQLLESKVEDLRKELETGKPCPLCGAIHHPYAEHLPEKNDQLDSEIKRIREELSIANKVYNSNSSSLENYKKQALALEERSKTLNLNLQRNKQQFHEKFEVFAATANLQELENKCDVLEEKIKNLAHFEEEQKKLQHLKAALPLLKKLQTILQEGKLLKEKLDEIYTGSDIQKDVEQFQNRWVSLERDLKNLQEFRQKISQQLNEKHREFQALDKELLPKINERGFTSISDSFAFLMPDTEANRLRQSRQEIEKKIDNLKARLKLLSNQLEEFIKQDSSTEEETLQEQLQEKIAQLEIVTKECQEIERILKNQEENLSRMKVLQQQIIEKEKQTRRWRLLNELVGDRTGNKFNDFAQDLSLSRLINLANIRLKDLSDRYLIDKPTEEEDDGLVAIDEHMGGQRRSVKTLSGGETFILSLSMALALSDLASKNVEINSLFIDEGFGTLDPETLDQTLDTLEKLQAESSKTIGVISHVDSLKERIATQIKLTRNGQGYSSLKVESL